MGSPNEFGDPTVGREGAQLGDSCGASSLTTARGPTVGREGAQLGTHCGFGGRPVGDPLWVRRAPSWRLLRINNADYSYA